MILALVFGLVLPMVTAGLLCAGTFAATRGVLRVARHWPLLHEWLVGLLGLSTFASTLVMLFVYFLVGIGFWHQFW